jgi:peroxiredoxin
MLIPINTPLPSGQLIECDEFDEAHGCPINPKTIDPAEITRGKCIVIFGVPGAFTPTCSQKHLPGFVSLEKALKAQGVDEIWCLAVNDHFVMASWGREQGCIGKIRMMADGSATYSKALGVDRDLTANGMGIRCRRFAMVVKNGVVDYLGIEESGQFGVSSAEAVLKHLTPSP